MKFAFVLLGLFLTVSAVPLELNAAQEELTKGVFGFLSGLFTDVFLPPITTAVQDTAGLLAQITAGIAEGGIDSILGLFGKRDVSAVPLDSKAVQEELTKGVFDFLSGLFTDVFLPPITTAVQDTAGLLAQITAGIAEGGIDSILGLFGKRDANSKGVWNDLLTAIKDGAYSLADQLAQQLGLTLTQILLQISQGKRSAEEFRGAWSDFITAIKDGAYNLADQLAQQLGLTLTQALLQISQGK